MSDARLTNEVARIANEIAASASDRARLGERSRELVAGWSAIGAEARRAQFEGLRRVADAVADAIAAWERGQPIGERAVPSLARILDLVRAGALESPDRWPDWSRATRTEFIGLLASLALGDGAASAEGKRSASVRPDMIVAVEPELLALFVAEVDGAAPRLQELVLALEAGGDHAREGEEAMRIAHSLKGAARIVGLGELVAVLHGAEDTLTAAQRGRALGSSEIQALLRLVDLLAELTRVPVGELAKWLIRTHGALEDVLATLRRSEEAASRAPSGSAPSLRPPGAEASGTGAHDARALRVSADSLSRLLGLAGETVVEARRLGAWSRSTAAVERAQTRVVARVFDLRERARASGDSASVTLIEQIAQEASHVTRLLADAQASAGQGLERLLDAGERLYVESLRARQRPFAQLLPSMRRQVRDAARALNKNAKLEVTGGATLVDGDVLASVEPMLHHLLVNALDHGLEAESVRAECGKPRQGTIRVVLNHARGQLSLVVTDDGGGIDHERIRATVLARQLLDPLTARSLGRAELLEMLFLPGFSTAKDVSVHSGRGVGLDAVRTECSRLSGRISLTSEVGKFTRFELTLPVTRVVVRALLVVIAGETFALPLAHAGRVVRVSPRDVHNSEGRDYVELDGENVGVIRADEVLELGQPTAQPGDLTLVLLGDDDARYGLVVDGTRGEDDLVVRPLDPRLGRVPDVAAAALLADGSPTLVLDVDDLMLSIEKLSRRRGRTLLRAARTIEAGTQKRVLVVDDSVTVREVQRQLLGARGYHVDVAVDGVEGWTMLRNGHYDLAVVDVDMPRMNGLELTRTIRSDARLAKLPVIIVSYKEGDDDRMRGLEVGADHYLAKSSFHDDQLANAVRTLIGDGR